MKTRPYVAVVISKNFNKGALHATSLIGRCFPATYAHILKDANMKAKINQQ